MGVGTEGGGLIRIPNQEGLPNFYREKRLPMSSIKFLRLVPGRLLIGLDTSRVEHLVFWTFLATFYGNDVASHRLQIMGRGATTTTPLTRSADKKR